MQHRQFLVCTKLLMTTTICEEKLTRPLRKFVSSCLMSRQPELTNSSNNWLKRISWITWMLKIRLLYMLISSLWLVSEWLLHLQIDVGIEAHLLVTLSPGPQCPNQSPVQIEIIGANQRLENQSNLSSKSAEKRTPAHV